MKLSAYTSIGKSKGFSVKKDGPSISIHILNLSFCIGWFDIEDTLENLLHDAQKSDLLKEQRLLVDENTELETQLGVYEKECQKCKEEQLNLQKQIKEKDKTLDELGDEITDLIDIEAENHKLKDKIEFLENKIEEMQVTSSSSESSVSDLSSKIDYHI